MWEFMHHVLCMQEGARGRRETEKGGSTLGVRTTQCKQLK